MSGIVGIVNLDGAPVDRRLLTRMTEFLAFRGPDAQRVWIDGAAGFGHTLLKTTDESDHEHQPLTLDGQVWIVADARVDARRDLIADLRSLGNEVATDVPDVELILRAYCVWGEGCVEHLLGDFAFGIWDAGRRRLFCARDHMGIRCLYYAFVGSTVIFSNTLDCIRQHPSVSDRLNDLAVADFLLFDLNQDKATTTFADIQRVPPARTATWTSEGQQVRPYWSLPIDEPLYYRRREDYVEHFRDLLRTAIEDRLRTGRVAIFMSGGIDSPTLAATANDLLCDRSGRAGVRAFTTTFEGFDEEGDYARMVAGKLGIAIDFQDSSEEDPGWPETRLHSPEPVPYPNYLAAARTYNRHVASHSRVAFFGEGSDNALLYEWRPYLWYLAGRKRFGRLLYDVSSHAILHRRIPLLPNLSRVFGQRRRMSEKADARFPEWLNPDFQRRFELRARWEQHKVLAPSPHPIRPTAYRSFGLPQWQALFETFDAAHSCSLLEVRQPFLDLRLLRYLLAVPALPWCRRKYLLRTAMRGVLPEPVLRRPKAPLIHDPWTERAAECRMLPLVPAPGINLYVDTDRLPNAPIGNLSSFLTNFRPLSFNYWLKNLHTYEHNNFKGDGI